MIETITGMTIVLFFWGFLYGAIRGNKDMNIIVRSLSGGLFFALWFIAIPFWYLNEWWDDRKQTRRES